MIYVRQFFLKLLFYEKYIIVAQTIVTKLNLSFDINRYNIFLCFFLFFKQRLWADINSRPLISRINLNYIKLVIFSAKEVD